MPASRQYIKTTDLDASVFACGPSGLTIIDNGNLTYNGATGELTHTNSLGDSQTVTLPLENFLASASYDQATNVLTMTLTDGSTVTVDLTDLIDNPAFGPYAGPCITTSVTGNGSVGDPFVIAATPVIDPNPDNALSCGPSGLFAAGGALQALDTDCIDTTVTGTGVPSDPWVVSSAPILDASGDNVAQCGAAGLLVNWNDVFDSMDADHPTLDCTGLPIIP